MCAFLVPFDPLDDEVVRNYWDCIAEYNRVEREAHRLTPLHTCPPFVTTGTMDPAVGLAHIWLQDGRARPSAFADIDWSEYT